MHRFSIFWGAVLATIGILLLLSNLGILTLNIWGILWPALLIMAGLRLLWGAFFRRNPVREHISIPLDGARRARVHIGHAAGSLELFSGAEPGVLASGEFGGKLEVSKHHDGDLLDVRMQLGAGGWAPWDWSSGVFNWSVGFNREIPLSLHLETGADETRLDLTDLQVTELTLKTGASSTEVRLPASAGQTQVEVHSGAASTRLYVPTGVAARVRFSGGLASLQVDNARFPQVGDVYLSHDFDSAVNRVDMVLETGVGSIEVR